MRPPMISRSCVLCVCVFEVWGENAWVMGGDAERCWTWVVRCSRGLRNRKLHGPPPSCDYKMSAVEAAFCFMLAIF